MQTILGASGQIGRELALSLKRNFTSDIRLVSRNPHRVNETDQLVKADLLDAKQTSDAVKGSSIVYLTAGLPMDTQLWVEQWPTMMRNVIAACKTHQAKLVYFDNTYMYPQTDTPQQEDAPFQPNGEKGQIRAVITDMLLESMNKGEIEAVICRAPEFYGPGKTQSITNSAIIDNLLNQKSAKVFLRDDTKRSLIYTPDASRAMALIGNTPDAYGQTWHLPCDDRRLTYREFIAVAAKVFNVQPKYKVIKRWQLWLAGRFNQTIRDAAELLPRYESDNLFVSDKFQTRFPDFQITTFEQGLTTIKQEKANDQKLL
ncbi:NAD-dependent epimerase/dehydratase family protein [Vibrio sp. VGrn 2]|uniref:SDR family oxidoreductase n=1 Tax=Vibrio sp. VGrn 2 TaxID=2419839 RepID=UPI00128CF00D|nr:SDR family oxidoreductase [Vibrio sp. VGrn 2]MPS39219.1 NAD-dependent epimerase/dehydratase family protein [Vibrio sp. VGrn 2]